MSNIRNVALAWIEHEGSVFVAEGYDSVKDETYYRSLGGGIEFGESASEAVMRELKEEMNADIGLLSEPVVIENIFELEGKAGHQMMFVFKAEFQDASFLERRRFKCLDALESFEAMWVPLSEFRSGNKILYPELVIEKMMSC